MASTSRPQLNPSSISVTFPSKSQYRSQIRVHSYQHKELNNFGQLTDQEIGSAKDYTCIKCYPSNHYTLTATEQFANFWDNWFWVTYRPRSGNALTCHFFDEIVKASTEKDQTVALAHLLLSIRFRSYPSEGYFTILNELCTA